MQHNDQIARIYETGKWMEAGGSASKKSQPYQGIEKLRCFKYELAKSIMLPKCWEHKNFSSRIANSGYQVFEILLNFGI